MGENSSQIERRIDTERDQLGQNLHELQSKVEGLTDWRAQFQKRPMVMMGVAIAGGMVLASMTGHKSRRRRYDAHEGSNGGHEHHQASDAQKDKALETFDNIKGAMIGLAASTFQNFVGQLIPGFNEQLRKTTQDRHLGTSSSTPAAARVATTV